MSTLRRISYSSAPFALLVVHGAAEAFATPANMSTLLTVRLVADAGLCAWALGSYRIRGALGTITALPLRILRTRG